MQPVMNGPRKVDCGFDQSPKECRLGQRPSLIDLVFLPATFVNDSLVRPAMRSEPVQLLVVLDNEIVDLWSV